MLIVKITTRHYINEEAWYGQINIVKCLIDDFSSNQNTKEFEGRTILHQACSAGHVEQGM